MGGFRLVVSPAAQRELERLHGPAFVAMRGVILALALEPRPPTAGKVAGSADVWRVRVRIDGVPWRVIYQVDQAHRTIVVTRVARRDESTYRRLPR